MRINKLHIINFGKISEKTLIFDENTQVIYGCNEAGKSTIMSFLRLMFYGTQNRGKDLEKQPRKLYKPWNNNPMEGEIELEHGGETYSIYKRFGDVPSKDTIKVINMNMGKEINLKRGQEVGEYFFQLDYSGFERSSFVYQIGSIGQGTGADQLGEKLITNLVDTGNEDVSWQETIKRLESAKYELVMKNEKKGILVEKRQELADLQEEQEAVKNQLEMQEQWQSQYNKLKDMQRDMRELEKSFAGWQASSKLPQLDELLALQANSEEIMRAITTTSCSYAKLPSYIKTLEEKQTALNEAKQYQRALSDTATKADSSPISVEELENLVASVKKIQLVETVENSWRDEVTPAFHSYTESLVINNNNKLEVEKYSKYLAENEGLYNKWLDDNSRLGDITNKLENINNIYNNKEELWNLKKISLAQSEADTNCQLEIIEADSKKLNVNVPLLVAGFLVLLIVVALGILVSPFIFSGTALGIVLIALSLVVSKKKAGAACQQNKKDLEKTLEDISCQREGLEKEEDVLKAEGELLKEESSQLSYLVESGKEAVSSYLSAKEQKNLAALSLERSEFELKKNTETFEHRLGKLKKAFDILEINEPSGLWEQGAMDKLSESIAVVSSYCKEEKNRLLLEKGATSLENYQEKYLAYQAYEGNRVKVKEQNELVSKLEKDFITTASLHTAVYSLPEAMSFLQKLKESITSLENIKDAVINIGNGMQISDLSQESLGNIKKQALIDAEGYSGDAVEDIREQLEYLRNKNIFGEMQELQQKIRTPERNIEQIAGDITEIKQQLQEMELYYESLSLALEAMLNAREQLRQSFSPLLNKKTGEYFACLTANSYSSLLVSDKYDIQVKSDHGYSDWRYLSDGTIDQAYLALRLAISDLVSPEEGHLPLFLDDVLMQYDDERALMAMKFLKDYSHEQGAQVIMFSCHGRTERFARDIQILTEVL